MSKADWEQLGHAMHLCIAENCQFRLGTRVRHVVVSTIGEYNFPDKIKHLKRNEGWEEIGCDRLYETMVFTWEGRHECGCPKISSFSELDMDGYNDAATATAGHWAMCEKWDKEQDTGPTGRKP